MSKKTLILLTTVLAVYVLFVLVLPQTGFAQAFSTPPGLPTNDADVTKFDTVRNVFLGICGAVAVLIITIAGFQYVTSQGEPQKISKAKDAILYSVVGLAVAVFASVIVSFVVKNI